MSFEARLDRAGRDRVLLLRGRILADHLGDLQRARCEAKNVALRRCPRYIWEWIETAEAQRASDLSSPADRGR